MTHTYHFYASNCMGRRVLKRSYTAPSIDHAYFGLLWNLSKAGLSVDDYVWNVGRSDKTREFRALRRAGHSVDELFTERPNLTHIVFDGADTYKETVAWLAYAESKYWNH